MITDHESTITSRRVRKVEDKLIVDLSRIVSRIRSESIYDISLLRRKYDVQVTDVVRNSIQRIYNQAVLYVTKFFNVSDFITATDLNKIKDYTLYYVDQFWFRVNKYVLGRNTVLEQFLHYHPRSPLSDNYIVTIVSTEIATRILSLATLNKTKQLAQSGRIDEKFTIRKAQFLPYFFEIVFQWFTARDDRVCPICRSYEGKQFQVDDVIPVPGSESAHPNCRCRLMLVEFTPTTQTRLIPFLSEPVRIL